MVWSANDQKRFPTKTVVGNVRIATLKSVIGGVHIVFFKDQCARKVRTGDIHKAIDVSNNIYTSRLAVHLQDKALVMQEPVPTDSSTEEDGCDDNNEDTDDNGEDDNVEDDNVEGDNGEDGNGEEANGEEHNGADGKSEDNDNDDVNQLSPNANVQANSAVEEGSTVADTGRKEDGIPDTVVLPPAQTQEQLQPSGPIVEGHRDGNLLAHEGVSDTNASSMANPPPPPNEDSDDLSRTLPDTLRELRAMETLVKEEKKAIRSMKKRQADPNDKRAQKKSLELQLKAINTEVKQEKAKSKLEQAVRPNVKRARCEEDDDDMEEGNEDNGWNMRPEKRVLNAIDKWQKGHRRAALSAATNKVVKAITVDSWEDACEKLSEHGWAVISNYVDLIHPACRADSDMRDYILDCTFPI